MLWSHGLGQAFGNPGPSAEIPLSKVQNCFFKMSKKTKKIRNALFKICEKKLCRFAKY